MGTNNTEAVKQQENNKLTGFQLHPENINRDGRPPKGQTMTDIMREILEEDLPSGKKRKEALVRKVLELAYEGNETMIKMAWNYLDGMPKQSLDMTSGGEKLGNLIITKNGDKVIEVAN
jgi:hypothetical protein